MSARPHFRLLGIPVRVEPVFVLIAVLMGFREGDPLWLLVAWVVIVFVSVLVHELGHAISLKIFGEPSSIVLHAFGGVTVSRRRLTRARSIVVSLAGSLTAILLLGLPARALMESDWATRQHVEYFFFPDDFSWWPVLWWLAFVNIWWSIVNLLPIRPLDGGNVASELFGVTRARVLSVVFAGATAVYAYVEGQRFAAFFLGMLGLLNIMEIRAERRGGARPVFDIDAPDAGGAGRPGGRNPRARRRPHLQPVPPLAGSPRDAPTAPATTAGPGELEDAEARAWSALRNGDPGAAARALGPHAQDHGLNPYLRASMVLVSGRAEASDELFERAYLSAPGGPPNLVAASLLAEHGRAAAVAARLLATGDGAAPHAAGTLQTHLHYAGRYREAAEVGELVFAGEPPSPAQTAFEVACSWAQAGEGAEAVRWVETAVDEGFTAGRLLDGEPDLATAREHPSWPAVRARVS